MKGKPVKIGRPSKYSPALIKKICDKLAVGIPLTQICKGKGMPCDRTVRAWVCADEDAIKNGEAGTGVSSAIAHAREEGFDFLAAECLQICDTVDADSGEIQRARLRIETRLKLLSKWNPRKYGDKLAVESDDHGPMVVFALPEEAKSVEDWKAAVEAEL